MLSFEVRHDAAGFTDEQNARGNVPRGKVQLPEAVECATGHRCKIEGSGARTSDSRRRADDGSELALIHVEVREMLERKSCPDQGFRGIIDGRRRDALTVPHGA